MPYREKIVSTVEFTRKRSFFMNMDKKTYEKFVKARQPRSPMGKNCIFAFLVGGLICTIGEGLFQLYMYLGMSEENVRTLVPVSLVFLAALLTGFGIFDDIARFAGAGTLVPITGFANAVVAPAIENKSEGFVMGVGVKLFSIAGPVIAYGTAASVIYGIIYYITCLF